MDNNFDILIVQTESSNGAPQSIPMNNQTTTSTQTAQQGTQQGTGSAEQPMETGMESWVMWVILLGMIAVFYLLIIRPQQKKQKELQKQIQALSKGDRILTTGGMYGTVVGMKDQIITVKVADNVRLEINKGFVSNVVQKASGSAEE